MEIFAIVILGVAICALGWPLGHMFQLEGYVLSAYLKWLPHNFTRVWLRPALLLALVWSVVMQLSTKGVLLLAGSCVVLALSLVEAWHLTRGKQVKKALVMTKRMTRLMIVYCLLFVVSIVLCVLEPYMLVFCTLAVPFYVWAAGWIMKPVEESINRGFFMDAKARLEKRDDLIKVGITGSYGKTSTKFILAGMLQEKYNVLYTASSINTPMGLTRVIREQLKPEHEVFIAEMGARHVGDIAELCDLVHPNLGIITSVGKQHLETFFTLENIVNTKYELIEGLAPGSHAFFANDNGLVRAMYDRQAPVEKTLSGFDAGCAVRAENLQVDARGSSFTLVSPEGSVDVTTKLLGRHNISNILVCAAAALSLGVTLAQIKAALAKLEPVEHRLQLLGGGAGITVIDDAFNSNPTGAKAALEVLGAFPGRKIIITPGMVELGDEEETLNREFGAQMKGKADYVILMGKKRTLPIFEGLQRAGFVMDNVYVVATMDEAMALLPKLGGAGDVVLFENDLPDNY